MADEVIVSAQTQQDGRVTPEVQTQLRKIATELAFIERRKGELVRERKAAMVAADPITVKGDVVVVLEPRFVVQAQEYELRRRRACVLNVQQRPDGTVSRVQARLYVGLTNTFDGAAPTWYKDWELVPR